MVHGPHRTAVPALASLAVLLLAAPRPSTALADLAGAASSADPTGPLVAAVSLAAWALAAWLVLLVAAVLLSRVPGLLGRTARALARRTAPATVRRAVEAALGLTVAVGGLGPTAALAAPVAGPAQVPPVVSSEPAWDLDWPSSGAQPVTGAGPAGTTAPVPPLAPRSAPSAGRPPVRATSSVSAPTVVPPPARPPAAAATVVVRPGDTLWAIAEVSLRSAGTSSPSDRQVAQAWPRWWAANREAVGDDPDLLLPGTVLRAPAGGLPAP